MDVRLIRVFQREIQTQCELFGLSTEFLLYALEHGPAPGGDPTVMVWMPLQGMLGSALTISKLCWGSGRKKERAEVAARRAPLRESLGLGDDSPLNMTRLRSALERPDEVLEAWYDDDVTIAPGRGVGAAVEPGAEADGHGLPLGRFDPTTWVVELLGHELSMRELGVEVERVLGTLRALSGESGTTSAGAISDTG